MCNNWIFVTHILQLELFLLCSNIQFMAVLPIFNGTLASLTLQEQLKTEIQEWEKRYCNIQRSYPENKAQPQRDWPHHTSLQATGAPAGKQTLILKPFCERLAYNIANVPHPTFSNSLRTLRVQTPTIYFKDPLNWTNTGCRWHQLGVATRPVQVKTVQWTAGETQSRPFTLTSIQSSSQPLRIATLCAIAPPTVDQWNSVKPVCKHFADKPNYKKLTKGKYT